MRIEALDYGSDLGYYTKGHVTESDFIEAVINEFEDDLIFENGNRVQYGYARKVPDSTGEFCYLVYRCEPGPGAFPITIIEP